MSFAINPIVQTNIKINNARGEVEFNVAMGDYQVGELMRLMGNPSVNKVSCIRWTRDLLKIDLRSALAFVEECRAVYEKTYRDIDTLSPVDYDDDNDEVRNESNNYY
jgi:hypothetical protein